MCSVSTGIRVCMCYLYAPGNVHESASSAPPHETAGADISWYIAGFLFSHRQMWVMVMTSDFGKRKCGSLRTQKNFVCESRLSRCYVCIFCAKGYSDISATFDMRT